MTCIPYLIFLLAFPLFLYTKSLPSHLIPPWFFILSSEMLRQLLCCFKFPVHLVSSQKHSVQLTSMMWAVYIKISNKTMVVDCSSSSTRTLEVVCIFTIFVPKKYMYFYRQWSLPRATMWPTVWVTKSSKNKYFLCMHKQMILIFLNWLYMYVHIWSYTMHTV